MYLFTKEEVTLTSKREELLLLSVVPSLAVEVDRSKIIKRLQQTFSLYMESAHTGSAADSVWLPQLSHPSHMSSHY